MIIVGILIGFGLGYLIFGKGYAEYLERNNQNS